MRQDLVLETKLKTLLFEMRRHFIAFAINSHVKRSATVFEMTGQTSIA